MKLKRLRTENIRSYKNLDILFKDGVSVVSGVNGSGKTSLLESCFIGIFGTSALSKEFKIEDIIRKGAKNSKILLEFEQNGKICSISREFTNGKTKNSILRMNGTIIDGVNPTHEFVCKLLGMNEESYTNCVYVRQGEIDILINAKPKDRQRMIDNLLQIGKLEEYRERVKDALTGIGWQERDKRLRLNTIIEEIERINIKEPYKQFKLETEKRDIINNEINELNLKKDKYRLKIDLINTKINEYKSNEQKKKQLEKEIENINVKITAVQNEIEIGRKKIHEISDKITLLEQEILKYETILDDIYNYKINKNSLLVCSKQDIEDAIKDQTLNEREIYQLLNEIKNNRNLLNNDRDSVLKKIEENKQNIQENEKNVIGINEQINIKEYNIQKNNTNIKELEINNNQLISRIQKLEDSKEIEFYNIEDEIKHISTKELQLHGDIINHITKIDAIDKKIQENLKLYENEKKIKLKKIEENKQNIQEIEKAKIDVNAQINIKKSNIQNYNNSIKKKEIDNNQSILKIKELEGKSEIEIYNIEDEIKNLSVKELQLQDNITKLSTKIDALEEIIQKEKNLIEKGKCPTCNQDLKGSNIEAKLNDNIIKKSLFEDELFFNIKLKEKFIEKKEHIEFEIKNIQENKNKIKEIFNNIELDKNIKENYIDKLKTLENNLKNYYNEQKELYAIYNDIEKQLLNEDDENEKKALENNCIALKKTQENVKNIKNELEKIQENKNKIKEIFNNIELDKNIKENYIDKLKTLENNLKNYYNEQKELYAIYNDIEKQIASLISDENNYTILHTKTQDKLKILKNTEKNLIEKTNYKNDIVSLKNENKSKQEIKTILTSQLYEKEDAMREIENELKSYDFESLKSTVYKLKEGHARNDLDIKNKNIEKDKIMSIIGELRGTLNRLEILKIDKKIFENKLIYINTVKGTAEELEAMYMRLRVELRARNIGALDAYLNEMFAFMYSNNAYSRVSLDSDYNLIIYEKDGTELEPKLLSGGERAILNLVFRCAIYRLLSQETLPPLILDEPTVFLDKGHVDQLIKLIELMSTRYGVDQILIVSHDESLLDSADHLYSVEKDPITNISSIRYLN